MNKISTLLAQLQAQGFSIAEEDAGHRWVIEDASHHRAWLNYDAQYVDEEITVSCAGEDSEENVGSVAITVGFDGLLEMVLDAMRRDADLND